MTEAFSWYDIGEHRIPIDNFTQEYISQLIQELDNETRTCIKINHVPDTLIICGGNQDRVKVMFREHGKDASERQHGTLVDPQIPLDASEIEIAINYDLDLEPLRYTVSKETAANIANYYIRHNALPEGLTWSSNIS